MQYGAKLRAQASAAPLQASSSPPPPQQQQLLTAATSPIVAPPQRALFASPAAASAHGATPQSDAPLRGNAEASQHYVSSYSQCDENDRAQVVLLHAPQMGIFYFILFIYLFIFF